MFPLVKNVNKNIRRHKISWVKKSRQENSSRAKKLSFFADFSSLHKVDLII